MSVDVTLPADFVPDFPPCCVVCEEATDDTLKIAHSSANPLVSFYLPIVWLFSFSRVTVPVCRACRRRFRLQRWGRDAALWVVIILAVWILWPHFADWSPLARKTMLGIAIVAICIPPIVLDVMWARYFDTTANRTTICYEFKSPQLAAAFHAANESHVVSSDVPEWLVALYRDDDDDAEGREPADDDEADDESPLDG